MSRSYLKAIAILAIVLVCSVSSKKKKPSSIKYISVYTEADSQGIELAACNSLDQPSIDKRTREFEQEGEIWGHLTANSKEMRVWLMDDVSAASDPKARQNFLSALRMISAANQRKGTQFFTKDRSRLTFSVEGWESKKPASFVFETEGKLYRGEGKSRGILKQSNFSGKAFIKPHEIAEVKRFQLTRNTNFGHNGLTYLYNYTGEVHVEKSNLQDIQKRGYKLAIVQSLFPTHFMDRYEMERDYPHVSHVSGKVHNIETIQDKLEQNLFAVMIDVAKESIADSPHNSSISVIKFDIPILIHSTVLPPQKEADFIETGIPKNSKVYVNFLKSNASELLKGRFVTDCLFESLGLGFVSVGAIDDNVNKRIVEQRHTLNFAYYSFLTTMTAIFSIFGLVTFAKIIASGFRQKHEHHYVDHHGDSAPLAKKLQAHSPEGDAEEKKSLVKKIKDE